MIINLGDAFTRDLYRLVETGGALGRRKLFKQVAVYI